MNEDCPDCRRMADEIIALKATVIRETDGRKADKIRAAAEIVVGQSQVLASAREDAISRLLGLGNWDLDRRGTPVLMEGGLSALTRTGQAVTLDLALGEMVEPAAPHLFGRSGADDARPVPGKKYNLTEIAAIYQRDPTLGRQLAQQQFGLHLTE